MTQIEIYGSHYTDTNTDSWPLDTDTNTDSWPKDIDAGTLKSQLQKLTGAVVFKLCVSVELQRTYTCQCYLCH